MIYEAYRKVTELGWLWDDASSPRAANPNYTIDDLVNCIDHDPDIANFYAARLAEALSNPFGP